MKSTGYTAIFGGFKLSHESMEKVS